MSQVVLITGCSRGLGKFLAETLASKGFIVYAGMRKQKDVEKLKTAWKNSQSNIRPIVLDITHDSDCQSAVKKIVSEERHLDILINSAAYALVGPTDKFTTQEFLDILNTNTVGAFRLIREVIPQMRSQKEGKIINITSLNGILALPNFGLYCSSKFALEALGLALRYELKKDNVWVVNIEPGAIASPKKSALKMPHRPAREKFLLLKILLPLVTRQKIVTTILKVIKSPNPPRQVLLGRDAQITSLLQRFLPQKIWDSLLFLVWNR